MVIYYGSRLRKADLYPSYHEVAEAKKLSYPDNIVCTETHCEVPLKDLVYHTVDKIFKCANLTDVLEETKLVIEWKYSLDSSSGHSQYKQKSNEEVYDDSLLCVCFVPLVMVEKEFGKNFWMNERPGSPRLCRPLSIR